MENSPGPPEAPSEMNGASESQGRTDLQRLESLAAHNGVNTSPVRIVVEPCWDDETPSSGLPNGAPNSNGLGFVLYEGIASMLLQSKPLARGSTGWILKQ